MASANTVVGIPSNMETQLAELVSSRAGSAGAVGIGTFIKDILRKKTPFTKPRPPSGVMFSDGDTVSFAGEKYKGRKGARNRGLTVGRITDMMYRDVMSGKKKLGNLGPDGWRLEYLYKALARRGVKSVRGQFPVSSPHLGIKTELDGLGVDASGAVVVIELKTTQDCIDRHNLLYMLPCQKRKTLANGLINSEYMAHQLQTGYGVMAMRAVLPKGTRVIGLVVVCTSDGARIYDVEPRFSQSHLFAGAPTAIRAISGTFDAANHNPVSFVPMPTLKVAEEEVLRSVGRLGYTSVDKKRGSKLGSFVAHNTGKTSYLVVALVYVQSNTAKMGHRKYVQLLLDARTLWISLKRKKTVRSCVFYYCENRAPGQDALFQTEMVGSAHLAVTPKETKKKTPEVKKRRPKKPLSRQSA
jgi:hypothetical protein